MEIMKISFRMFKKVLVGLLATFVVLQAGPAFSAPKSLAEMKPTVWRTQSCVPMGHYVCQAIVHFGKEVEQRTGGKLKIEVLASGGLGIPIPKTVSAVRDGLMNMGEILGAFTHGEFPLSDVMELPGLVPGDLKVRREICKALAPYYEKVLPEKYNQIYLGSWQNDARVIALNKKKVNTIGDLKGLKIRASGPNEVSLCKILGAAPVSIATPEVYTAMSQGTVDGCFGADSWLASAKFWEVTKYIYSMEFDGHQMHWSINKQDFMALPPDVQKIVRESAAHAIEWVWPEVASEQRSGRKMLADHGVQYVDITSKDWAHFVEISKPIVEEWGKKGGPVALEMLNATKKVVSGLSKGKK
jgi:TRAP-type C4-dicarboxylate transport system substrate-binding protein